MSKPVPIKHTKVKDGVCTLNQAMELAKILKLPDKTTSFALKFDADSLARIEVTYLLSEEEVELVKEAAKSWKNDNDPEEDPTLELSPVDGPWVGSSNDDPIQPGRTDRT